jgi:hypothetical protein
MEERVPSKNSPAGAILHQPAYAILCMTWCIQSLDRNVSNLKSVAVLRGLRNTLTVFAANYGLTFELGVCKLWSVSVKTNPQNLGLNPLTYQFLVSSSMIPVAN